MLDRYDLLEFEIDLINEATDRLYQDQHLSSHQEGNNKQDLEIAELEAKIIILKKLQEGSVDNPFHFFKYFYEIGSKILWNCIKSDPFFFIPLHPGDIPPSIIVEEESLTADVTYYDANVKVHFTIDIKKVLRGYVTFNLNRSWLLILSESKKYKLAKEKIEYFNTEFNSLLYLINIKNFKKFKLPASYTTTLQDNFISIPDVFLTYIKQNLKEYGVTKYRSFENSLKEFRRELEIDIKHTLPLPISFGYSERTCNTTRQLISEGFRIIYHGSVGGEDIVDRTQISLEDFVSIFLAKDIKELVYSSPLIRVSSDRYFNIFHYFLNKLAEILERWGFKSKRCTIIGSSGLFFCTHKKDISQPISNNHLYGNLPIQQNFKEEIDKIFDDAYSLPHI